MVDILEVYCTCNVYSICIVNVQLVSSDQLLQYLAHTVLEARAPEAQLNWQQNTQDAIDIFPNLQTGLDINVKFTGCTCSF